MNIVNVQQDLKFAEYPEVGLTHLIMIDGTVFSNLAYQPPKQGISFVSSAMIMNKWTSHGWF